MELIETLKSEEDKSVNFVFDNWLEARFVRRTSDYFIVYLSSHDGCNKACRFCHLTQTGQTSFNQASLDEYLLQAQTVMNYYRDFASKEQGVAQRVNFNFMARGEPLANELFLTNLKVLLKNLGKLAKDNNLEFMFNVSSIFPDTLENKLDILEQQLKHLGEYQNNTMLYYSLYSIEKDFRKRWLPKALDYKKVLSFLEKIQLNTDVGVAFHWAFIENENDSEISIDNLIQELSSYKIEAKFNLVRYNPFSNKQGKEPEEHILQKNFDKINIFLKNPNSRIVPRVGFDVKASCGMFVIRED